MCRLLYSTPGCADCYIAHQEVQIVISCYSYAALSLSKAFMQALISIPSSSLLSPHHHHFQPSTSPWGGGGGPHYHSSSLTTLGGGGGSSLSLIITHSPHHHPQAHHLLCTEDDGSGLGSRMSGNATQYGNMVCHLCFEQAMCGITNMV